MKKALNFIQDENDSLKEHLIGNYYTIKTPTNFIIFNSVLGNPVTVDFDFYARIRNGNLTVEDISTMNACGIDFSVDSLDELKLYEDSVFNYVDTYRGPEVLDLMISESCNLSCGMCIYKCSKQRLSDDKIMSFDIAKQWLDFYINYWSKKNELEKLIIHFGVAEPLLNKDCLHKSIEYINKTSNGVENEISINSNLTLLDENFISIFAENKIFVNVGLDGDKDGNDSTRIDNLGKGTFDVIIKNIKALTKQNVNVGVALTLTDANFKKVNPKVFLHLMQDLGIKSVLVDPDLVSGLNYSPEVVTNKLIDFQVIGNDLGIDIRGDWKAPFENLISESNEPTAFCQSIMGKNIAISPNGNLFHCCYSSDLVYKKASSIKMSFENFTNNMKNKMSNYWHSVLHIYCAKCPLVGQCVGGCHVTREQQVGVAYMCDIYKLSTSKLLSIFYS